MGTPGVTPTEYAVRAVNTCCVLLQVASASSAEESPQEATSRSTAVLSITAGLGIVYSTAKSSISEESEELCQRISRLM